jgi:hypothetical protein
MILQARTPARANALPGRDRFNRRGDRPWDGWGEACDFTPQCTLALAGGIVLLVANPAVTGGSDGAWPPLDWQQPACVVGGALAIAAIRHPATG